MSESADRDKRPGGKPESQRPDRGGPAKGAPRSDRGPRGDAPRGDGYRGDSGRSAGAGRAGAGRDSRDSSGEKRPWSRDGKPEQKRPWARDGKPDDKRVWTRDGAPARGDRSASQQETPEDRDPFGTRSVRPRHDDPIIPDDVKPADLDRVARAQLKTLSKENADGVAEHLVMAARLIESDPQLAHKHAVSAARRAGRIAVVRETLAITAYSIGDFALALRELRTYRRISGRDDQLPMMVDCERGLGRPDRALELGRSVPRSTLPADVQVELAIAMSGARLDLDQKDAALAELEIPQLDPQRAFSYSPSLFAAYAAVLEDLGREADAKQWYERADRAAAALDGESDSENEDIVEVFEEEVDDEDFDAAASVDTADSDVTDDAAAVERPGTDGE